MRKCKKIKIVLTDVDGVLTDGGMYYSDKGDIMKKFHVLDGMGVTLLRKKNIPTIIITKEKTRIVKQWTLKMKIEKLYDGIIQKEAMFDEICRHYKVQHDEVAYIGDDINDVELLKKVGLSATPRDGIKKAKDVCDYICRTSGGCGAFRELADLILSRYE
ncbi:MAG: KdsC family phosphatase [Nitrosotalea sp.]